MELFIGVLNPKTPNPRHEVVFTRAGSLLTSSPNRYVIEKIYFACFLRDTPQ
jgi:hypothetical protein